MITPQSANWTACVASKPGRRPIIQALIEGVPDVLCSEEPADKWSKTKSFSATGTTSPLTNYLYAGQDASLTNLADWTVVAWVKQPSGGGGGFVLGAWQESTTKGWKLHNVGGYYYANWTGSGGSGTAISTAAIANNTWEYVAASVGGLNSTVVMGVHNSTSYGPFYAAASRATRNSFTAGVPVNMFSNISGAGVSGIAGSIGYAAVFNRALTHDEMRRLKYRCLSPRWGNDDSDGLYDCCVAEWRMERVSDGGYTITNNRNPGTSDAIMFGDAAIASDPPFSVTYRALGVGVTTGASIDVLATRTTIQSTALRVPDSGEWLTSQLASTSLGLMRRNVRIFLGFSQILESEYQPVMSGKITDIDYEASVYTLGVSDAIFDAKSKITIGKGTLQAGINAAVTTAQIQTNRFLSVSNDQDGKVGYVKIDSEIIAVDTIAAVSASAEQIGGTLTRGALSSTAATHSSGASVSEVVLFDWAPLTVARYLLLSSAGFEATSVYDGILESAYIDATTRTRRERGAKMSPSDVAVAEIGALAAASYSTLAPYIEEDIPDIKDWIEREILRGAGCYFAVKPDGRLTIRSLLVPSVSVYSLTPDRVRGKARWKISDANIVNWIDIEYGYNILTGNNDATFIATDATSGQTYGIRRRSYTLPASTSSSDLTTVTGQILQRYKNPTVTLEIECGLYEMMLEIGDCVRLTDWSLPDIVSGYRGVTKLLCEVTGRSVDFSRGTVKLTLLDISRM